MNPETSHSPELTCRLSKQCLCLGPGSQYRSPKPVRIRLSGVRTALIFPQLKCFGGSWWSHPALLWASWICMYLAKAAQLVNLFFESERNFGSSRKPGIREYAQIFCLEPWEWSLNIIQFISCCEFSAGLRVSNRAAEALSPECKTHV